MPKNQEKHTTINLTAELRELLDDHCEELDLTKSELIRLSLNHYLSHLKIGKVRGEFLDQCARKGFGFGEIISEAIENYVEESRGVRLEARQPSEAEQTIRELGGEG